MPPHYYQTHSMRNGDGTENRFSKDVLLSVYKSQKDAGELAKNLTDLVLGDWQTGGGATTGGSLWNRRDEGAKDSAPGADVCWDANGTIVPLALLEMTESEREVR